MPTTPDGWKPFVSHASCEHEVENTRLRDRLALLVRENAVLVSERDIARRRIAELERDLASVRAPF